MKLLPLLKSLLILALATLAAKADPQDGALRVELTTAYNFIVDSNVESPSTYAPRAAYISARIWNDGTTPITNATAYIGDKLAGTPGLYPRRAHLSLNGPLAGDEFAFTHEGGSLGAADATRSLGTIPPGGYIPVYWLVSYPNVDEDGNSVTGGVNPADDLFLYYDIWATGTEGATPRNVDVRRKIYMRNSISAMANKILPNTANKVPPEYQAILDKYQPSWNNLPEDGSPGTRITTEGIWYDLGNVGQGFDNDGDLVPDQNAWLQPVGDPSIFDASAFRLVRTFALIVVKLKSGGEAVYDVTDQLYFTNLPDNNGVIGLVRYDYLSLQQNASSSTSPYQMAASGFENEKFNGDFGTTFALSSPPTSVTLDKTVNTATAAAGDTLTYSLNFANPGTIPVGDPVSGMTLVIEDAIPPGTTYVAGSAAAGNTEPSGVGPYEIRYSTDNGTTWSTTQPTPASAVTDLQWWLPDALPAGSSGSVTFAVTVNSPFANNPPVVVNVGGLSLGGTQPFITESAETFISGNNSISGTVFVDNGTGTGGVFGDGIRNGTEAPIPTVLVSLYLDTNNNGQVDPTDLLWATQSSSSPAGTYAFTNLPDGNFLIRVDPDDTDIPNGHVPTDGILRTAALDPAGTNPVAVNVTNRDFGFAPILVVEKSGPATAREGELVNYTINLSNNFVGDGTGGLQVTTDHWATTAVGDTGWANQPNAADAPTTGPNGTYSSNAFGGKPDDLLTLGGYATANTGSIQNVQFRVAYKRTATVRAGDQVRFDLLYNGSVIHTSGLFNASSIPTTATTYTFDVTSLRAWTFADLSLVSVVIDAAKGGGSAQGGSIDVDQAGLRIVSQGTLPSGSLEEETLSPVPLLDSYDPTRLQFVSSTPPATSVNATTGEIFWADLGPIFAGGSRSVTVTFRALEPPNNTAANTTNLASSTGATLLNGTPVNDAEDTAVTNILPAGTLAGRLWRDINPQNGLQEPSETGIGGVTVTINGPSGYTATTTTDADGNYLFTGLPTTGNYTVTVNNGTLPGGAGSVVFNQYGPDTGAGSNIGTVSIDVNSTTGGDKVLNADFGYTGLQSLISGTVWNDVNRNAATAPDTAEPSLAGITVRLFDATNTLVATTTTAADGSYQFIGNFSGTYSVRIDTATGPLGPAWFQTYDSDGLASAHRSSVTVPSGGSATADFSYALGGVLTIGDTLFYDWNGNGSQDTGEEGIPEVTVRLFLDQDGNSSFNPALDPLVSTTATSVNGSYLFNNLPAGSYFVIVDLADSSLPSSYLVTADPDGAANAQSRLILTTASNLDQDFGFQPTGTGTLDGVVWRDRNSDETKAGIQETGITGVSVVLQVDLNGDGIYQTIATTTTAVDGTYSFTDLPDANYRVVVDPDDASLPLDPYGNPWYATTATQLDVTMTGATPSDPSVDFGFNSPSALGGTVFFDLNENGDRETAETNIAGVTVVLYQNGSPIAATLTDATGDYLFTGLLPGEYTVAVDPASSPLAGASLTADPDNDGEPCGVLPTPAPCDAQVTRTLGPAQTLSGLDFGYALPGGTISGILWADFDDDDQVGDEEARFPYIQVDLYDGSNTLIATTFTDENGYYSFGGLADGTYRVEANPASEIPALYSPSFDPDSTLDEQSIVSIVNANDATADFGYQATGTNTLSGTVGLETADPPTGLMNGTNPTGTTTGETPFFNVPIYLYVWEDANNDNIVDSNELTQIGITTTNAAGDYEFTNLPDADSYVVSLSAPIANLILTTAAATPGHPADSVVVSSNSQGHTTGAYQVVAAAPSITNMDFAFISAVDYDFGDLPDSYSTLLPFGARHIVKPVPDLFLGTAITLESNGQPSPNADADAADDGVLVSGIWANGVDGGSLAIQVNGSGWLVGYIDFENNGSFTDAGNLVISQPVSTGPYNLDFDVPPGTLADTGTTFLNARFRLLPTQPFIPELAYSGEAANGEVEDYRWPFHTVSGFVKVDDDDTNGFSGGDLPQPGTIVRLYDGSNNLLATTVTDYTGYYVFSGLPSASYEVRMETPSGATAILDADAGDPTRITATLAGTSLTGQDFLLDGGFVAAVADIRGTVFTDDDRDDDFSAGDLPREAVTVALYRDVNTDGIPDAFEFVGTAATDALGNYEFPDLPSGSYLVILSPSAGIIPFLDVDSPANDEDLIAVTLAGTDVNDRDFLAQYNASLAGTVRIDNNGDTVGDVPQSTVTIELLDSNGDVFLTTTTDSNGFYQFTNLPPGTYSIRQTVPNTYLPVNDFDGGDFTVISTITLGLDVHLEDLDFVNRLDTASVAGRIWFDADLDGLRETLESNVTGITVRLLDNALNVVATTTTAADGTYLFANVVPGTYQVEFVAPSGTAYTLQNADSQGLDGTQNSDASPTTGRTATFTLAFGDDRIGVDAGLVSADLAVTKTASVPAANIGDDITYTITVTNLGPTNSTGIELTEFFPLGLNLLTSTPSQGSVTGNLWQVGGLAVGQSATLTLTADILSAPVGTGLTNSVAITAAGVPDPVAANNSDSATVQISGLTILKTSDQLGYVAPGNTITYTMVVQNVGNTVQSGVTVSDLLPAGLTYVPNSVQATMVNPSPLQTGSQTFNTVGLNTFTVPLGVSAISVQAWGGGGSGAASNSNNPAAGGGGGGAFSALNAFGVTPGQTFQLSVGGGGASAPISNPGNAGGGTWFLNPTTLFAAGGSGGTAATGGLGGSSAQGIGSPGALFSGGAGGNGAGSGGTRGSGGGGGSAFTNAVGGAGAAGTSAAGGAGGAGTGAGGTGGYPPSLGQPGTAPGGGGGGGTNAASGAGAAGRVTVSYSFVGASGTTGAPPAVASGWTLVPGATLTVTFQATLNAQPPAPEILNIAQVTSDVVESPMASQVSDPVVLSSILGTVRADTNGDGSPDTTLGGISLTLLDAANNPIATTTTAGDGSYSFTSLPAGTYRVVQTQPDGYGSLSDKDGGDPNAIEVIVLPAQDNTGNDFLEYLQKCPPVWTDWQAKWTTTLSGQTGATQNPDGDRYSNLIEFAFCLPPNSGTAKPFCLSPSLTVNGGIDGVYRRTAIGGAEDVTYTLEWTAALGDPTVWTGSAVLNDNALTITNNGDGTETVRIPNLEGLTGLTGSGFVRLRVELDDGVTTATDYTDVLGWTETPFGICCQTYNNPYRACTPFSGTITGVTDQTITFGDSPGADLLAALAGGGTYYVEVTSGSLEGHRFDVASASANTLTLANDVDLYAATAPFNTLTGAPPAELVGALISVHRHRTLDELFPPTAFGATNSAATADEVQVFSGGTWQHYWLFNENDADPATASWRTTGGDAPAGTTIIPPGQGVFFNNRTGPTSLLSYGEVRENDFVRPLALASNLVGGGYPIDQSPGGTGGRAMNLGTTFFGSRDFKTADSIFVWRADANPNHVSYDGYHYLNGAPNSSMLRWVKTGDTTLVNQDGSVILENNRAVFIRRATANPTYTMPSPWTP